MRNLVIVGGLCLLLFLGGVALYFGSRPDPAPVTPEAAATAEVPAGKNISFRVIDQGGNAAGVPSRKNYAIYDPEEFKTFWGKVHAGDTKAAPVVDFSKEYVIAVFAGAEPSSGYRIGVDRITETGDARTVAVKIEKPDESCAVIEETTYPYQFIVVPFSDVLALAHTDEVTKAGCH